MFNATKFLEENFQTPARLRNFLRAYDLRPPTDGALQKWFQREQVPSEWLPVLLAYLELEHNAPVRMSRYLTKGA